MENKITSGIWFVFIGLVLLLHNLDIIHFNFWAIIKYWPLLVVIAGINLIVQHKTYGNYIKIGSNVLFLAWMLYVGMTAPNTNWSEQLFNSKHIHVGDIEGDGPMTNAVYSPFDAAIEEATLEFNGGAGKFEMQTQEITNLVSARAKTDDMGMNIRTTREDGNQKVVINAQPTAKTKKSNTVSVDLHPELLWNIQLTYGAATINNDIAANRFTQMEVNPGASKMTLTLGAPQVGISNIDIATGASTIHLRIPKEAAVKVEYTSILSKNSFEGLESTENGIAKTRGYDQAVNKFDIELEGAANNFTITRY